MVGEDLNRIGRQNNGSKNSKCKTVCLNKAYRNEIGARVFIFFFVVLLCLSASLSYSWAQPIDYDLSLKSYLYLERNSNDENFSPFYEKIDINVTKMLDGNLSFHSSGWFRYRLGDSYGNREYDELTYAYLSYNPPIDSRLTLNAGRLYVFGGVAREHVDGLSLKFDVTPYLGLSVYGGRPIYTEKPVNTIFNYKAPDTIYGARVNAHFSNNAEIGISYLKELKSDTIFREEFGLDSWFSLNRFWELQGESYYNNKTSTFMDHSYTVRLFPSNRLTLSGLVSYSDFKAAFYETTSTAFMPEYLKDDNLTKFMGSAEYKLLDNLSATVDLANYDYDVSGSATYYGAKLKTSLDNTLVGVSLHRMNGDSPKLRYMEYRGYATRSFDKLKAALDIIAVPYDRAVGVGESSDFSCRGTLGYDITNSLNAQVTMDYGKTYDINHRFIVFAKIVYNLGKVTSTSASSSIKESSSDRNNNSLNGGGNK